jgi:hypothetical protein
MIFQRGKRGVRLIIDAHVETCSAFARWLEVKVRVQRCFSKERGFLSA